MRTRLSAPAMIRLAAALFLAVVAFSALIAGLIAPFDPLEQEVGRRLAPPSASAPQ